MLENRRIETWGVVTQHERVPAGNEAGIYYFTGDTGGRIEVRTTDPLPTVNSRKDKLQGIVQLKAGQTNVPIILETPRVPPPPLVDDGTRGPVVVQPDYTLHYILAGVAGLLVVLGFVAFMLRSKRDTDTGRIAIPPPPIQTTGSPQTDDTEITIRRNDTTVRISDNTVKFLPGHLVLRAGGPVGTKLPLCGGNRITLGRAGAGGRGPNYIGLDDPTKGLSRNQAVIAYDDRTGAFVLENQKGANPTTLDGRPLAESETAPLKEGMIIGFLPDYQLEFRKGMHMPSARA